MMRSPATNGPRASIVARCAVLLGLWLQCCILSTALADNQLIETIRYLPEPNATAQIYTPNAVLRDMKQAKIAQSPVLNFGYAAQAYWLEIAFQPQLAGSWLLQLANPRLQSVVFYLFDADNRLLDWQYLDGQQALSERRHPHETALFGLQLQAESRYRVLLRVQSPDTLILPINLIREADFQAQDLRHQVWRASFFGALLAIVVLNLVLGVSSQNRAHIFFAGFMMALGLALAALSGLTLRWLWPGMGWWDHHHLPLVEGLAAWTAAAGTRCFFNLDDQSPRLLRLMVILQHLGLLVMVLTWIAYPAAILLMTLTGILGASGLLITAWAQWRCGAVSALWFGLAWSPPLLSVMLYGMTVSGMALVSPDFAFYSLHGGILALGLLMSHAIGLRVRQLRELHERAQQQHIQRQQVLLEASNRFVPQGFLDFLDKPDIGCIQPGDHRLVSLAILFMDWRNFTGLAEHCGPEQTFALVNAYFSAIEPLVEQHHGFVDKYIGDAILALFPRRSDDALEAALAIQQQLHELNDRWRDRALPPLRAGIGIHYGQVMLGTVGTAHRMDTTVIGDAVNTAARLEQLTKQFQVDILISMAVVEHLDRPESFNIGADFPTKIHGKRLPLRIAQLAGSPPERPAAAIPVQT